MRYPLNLYPAKINGVSMWTAESTVLPISASANTPFQALLDLHDAENKYVEHAFSRGEALPDIPIKVLPPSTSTSPGPETAIAANQQDELTIYTDGACSGNPGPGGWAFIILHDGQEVAAESGGAHATTKNRMAMMALYQALRRVEDTRKKLTIVSDSQYVIKSMQGAFAKKKNQDLWALIDAIASQHDIEYKWVRGHAGDPHNEKCDSLAVMESRRA